VAGAGRRAAQPGRRWRSTIAAADAGVENQTLAASFATLCVDARSQHDYMRSRVCSTP
jgi:cell division protein ZapE